MTVDWMVDQMMSFTTHCRLYEEQLTKCAIEPSPQKKKLES